VKRIKDSTSIKSLKALKLWTFLGFIAIFALVPKIANGTDQSSQKSVILFIHNSEPKNDYFPSDAEVNKYSFEAMQRISSYNKNIRVVDVGVEMLPNLPEKVQAALAPDEVVTGVIYSGHGSANSFSISSVERYNGSMLGTWTGYGLKGVPTAETLNILLWSCSCGYESGDTSFQSQFSNALKVTLDDVNKKPVEINVFAHMAITHTGLVNKININPNSQLSEQVLKKYIFLKDNVFRFFDRKFGRKAASTARDFVPYILGLILPVGGYFVGEASANNFGVITGLASFTLSSILLFTLENQSDRALRSLHIDNEGRVSDKPLNSIENIPRIFANKCELKLQ